MKPVVIVTHRIHPHAIQLLCSLCEIAPIMVRHDSARAALLATLRNAHALLLPTTEHIDESMLCAARELCVVACAFHIPEHIDISACTRRGIWVTTAPADYTNSEAELIAARNILDALGGDTPRNALNTVPAYVRPAVRRDARRVVAAT
jgi:phosphonate dehydrogenase